MIPFFLYLLAGEKRYRLGVSPHPEMDLQAAGEKYRYVYRLSPPLPAGQAAWLLAQVAEPGEQAGCGLEDALPWWRRGLQKFCGLTPPNPEQIIAAKQAACQRLFPGFTPPSPVDRAQAGDEGPAPADLAAVRDTCAGRILFPEEVARALRENGLRVSSPLSAVLYALTLAGEGEMIPAVTLLGPGRYRCNRCGQTKQVRREACGSCGESACAACTDCRMMGESRLCKVLYAQPGSAEQAIRKDVSIDLAYDLTPAQADAARQVAAFMPREERECLVWAACGAGKTEVSFAAIAATLSRGEKVLFAVPRRDIVRELAPRLEAAFPGVTVNALYGGSPGKYQPADITLATTHQVIRFYRQFALVVLDEADAFPYFGSAMLYHAVARARKRDGKIIYMTATPDREMAARAETGKMVLVRIPARHHGYPLPEPECIITNLYAPNGYHWEPPAEVRKILQDTVTAGTPLFCFVPTVSKAEQIGHILQRLLSPAMVTYSHAGDPHREEKQAQFATGEIPVMVTTTILERGITVPRANVLVLYADWNEIFDGRTLIQMAGRAGRTREWPDGRVWYVARDYTREMRWAAAAIRAMNREAKQRGYLNGE